MKKTLLTLLLVFTTIVGFGQCPSTPIVLNTQAEIDSFQTTYPNCTQILNNLKIHGSDIVSLAPLNGIVSVAGELEFYNCNGLTSFSGLENINSVGVLIVTYMDSIIDFNGLNGIQTLNGFDIRLNDSLINFNGLQGVSLIGTSLNNRTWIGGNNNLLSVDGFLSTIENGELINFWIGSNISLTSLSGIVSNTANLTLNELSISSINLNSLEGLEFVKQINTSFYLLGENLITTSGLENVFFNDTEFIISSCSELTSFGNIFASNSILHNVNINNSGFTTMEGFENVVEINREFDFVHNDNLTSFVGLENTVFNIDENVTNLEGFQIFNNANLISLEGLGEINISNQAYFRVSGNEMLQNLNGPNLNILEGRIRIYNNDQLQDISNLQYLEPLNIVDITITGNSILSNCSVLSICNFLSNNGDATFSNNGVGCENTTQVEDNCGQLSQITGQIKFDYDVDGCSSTFYSVNNIPVVISNNIFETTLLTNENGIYTAFIEEMGIYNVTILDEGIIQDFTVDPLNQDIQITVEGEILNANFCLTSNNPFNDLKVSIIPLTSAIPGFATQYEIVFENLGTEVVSGTVSMTYDGNRQSFIFSDPEQNTINGNMISWDYIDLVPFESRRIEFRLSNEPPPTNNSGDVLSFQTQINPVNDDVNPIDNSAVLNQTMVNSFDPNDKQVAQGEGIFIEQVGEYLNYIIRFQNTGTADAIFVRLEDELSDNLQWDTFRTLSSSHDYRVEIVDGNQVSFFFDDIFLPPEQDDPEGSNGYVAFQVRSNNDLVLGDSVENTAAIFFDFNAPIITNTVITTVVEPLAVEAFDLENTIKIYPNPSTGIINISILENTELLALEIYSISGQKLLESTSKQLDVSSLQAGVYFVKIQATQGTITKKIVKE